MLELLLHQNTLTLASFKVVLDAPYNCSLFGKNALVLEVCCAQNMQQRYCS